MWARKSCASCCIGAQAGLNHLLESKELKNYLAQRGFGVKELFYRIGNGSINPHAFLDELLPKPIPAPVPEALPEPAAAIPTEVTEKILVEGLADVELRLAKCCCPRPGDAIMALVTRGAGVSIHRLDCGNIQFPELAPRLLSARFLAKVEKPTQVNLIITAEDRKGLLMDMIEIITEQGGDVSSAKVDVKDTMATLRFTVSIPHSIDLPKVRTALTMVDAVKAVRLEHQNP